MKDIRRSCVDYVAGRLAMGHNKHSEVEDRRQVSDFKIDAECEINNMTNLELLDLIESVENL